MASHGKDRYKIFGDAPEIEKLPNDRTRIVVRCDVGSMTEDWHYENRENLWREFGDLYSTPIKSSDGWAPRMGESYPNMALIAQEFKYLQGKTGAVVEFVYETLTSTWVNEDTDKVRSTENGLRTLTRTQVSLPGTPLPYSEDDIGVATITDGAKTLYLAGIEDAGSERKGIVQTKWAEKGIISVREQRVGGQQTVIVETIGLEQLGVELELSEVTFSHEFIDVSTGNYDGFVTKNYTFEVNLFDIIEQTANGLLTVIRTQLSASNFPRGNVGVDTISGFTEVLYLAGETIDNGNAIKRRVSRWAQQGLISESFTLLSEGVREVSYTFIGTQGTVVGPIIAKSQDNIDGFTTFNVKTLQDSNGNPLSEIEEEANLVNSFGRKVPFTIPGEVYIERYVDSWELSGLDFVFNSITVSSYFFRLNAPVNIRPTAKVYVFFQQEPFPQPEDEIYDGAKGYWNPVNWATTETRGFGTNFAATSLFSISQGKTLVNYRSIPNPDDGFKSYSGTGGVGAESVAVEGNYILPESFFSISVDGGPEDPRGNKWVVDIDIRPAFEDVDGNKFYKKTIVVCEIPL